MINIIKFSDYEPNIIKENNSMDYFTEELNKIDMLKSFQQKFTNLNGVNVWSFRLENIIFLEIIKDSVWSIDVDIEYANKTTSFEKGSMDYTTFYKEFVKICDMLQQYME